MALCPQCGGHGKFYFGDATQPTCPSCAGTGEVYVPASSPSSTASSGRRTSSRSRGQGRDGEFVLGLLGLACLFGAYLAFNYSSDVVLSYFELVHVRENNVLAALLYGGSTLAAVGAVSRFWGPAPGMAIGLIPLLPVIRAMFTDELGWFPQIVSFDAGLFLMIFAAGSALLLNGVVAMSAHERARKKLGIGGVRSLARLDGGPLALGSLAVLSLAALVVVELAWAGFVAANAH